MSRALRLWWRRSPGDDPGAAAKAARPLSVALCGAGMIGRVHGAAACLAGHSVAAVASPAHEQASAAASELGASVCTVDDLLAGRIAADLVVVTTPPDCRARHAIELLDRGYAVMVERPLCHTLDDADALHRAAARNGNRLWYGENLVYAPVVQQLLARARTLGSLSHLEVRWLQATPGNDETESDGWGDGALFHLGPHPLALALLAANAAGAGLPTSVSAETRCVGDGTSDGWAAVQLHYPTGLTARVEAGWHERADPVGDVQLASATGVVRAEIMPTPTLECNGEPVVLALTTTAVAALELLGFVAQISTINDEMSPVPTPTMSVEFGRFVLDVVCASYRSAARGGEPESLPFTGPRALDPLDIWRRG